MPRAARRPPEPQIEAEEGQETQIVDEASQVEHRSGQVAQGDEFISALARKAGWTPKEEWKRDPARWVDERTYLEHLPDELDLLKERNRRTAQAAADLAEETRRVEREKAEAAVRAAAEAGDPDQAQSAARQLAKVSGPPPQTVAWMGQNTWFNDDPDAQMMAVAEINRLALAGASIDDQLSGATAKVRKRFPEHFGQAERMREPEREEVRLSERRAPPAVAAGTRGGSSVQRERGFADVPPGDRAAYAKYFAKNYESMGLKPEEAQARYARKYWENKGETA